MLAQPLLPRIALRGGLAHDGDPGQTCFQIRQRKVSVEYVQ